LLQLQVLLDFVGVEVVLRFSNLFGVVAVVPGLDGDVGAFLLSNGLHVGDFFADARDGGRPNLHQQFHGRFGSLGDLFLNGAVSEGRVALQLGSLGTQFENFGNAFLVVVLIAVVSAAVVGAPDLLAQS